MSPVALSHPARSASLPRRLLVALTLLAAALMALVGTSGAAHAAYPPGASVSLTASVYDPCSGSANTLGGTGFQPGDVVTITVEGSGRTIGTARVGADGTWQGRFDIPRELKGTATFVAADGSGNRASAVFTIACVAGQSGDASAVGGSLAYTGVVVGSAIALAALLLVTGGALLVLGRRRTRAGTTA